MARADSPLKDKLIFSFGARRSGTWWLQRLIGAHPRVAPVHSETYLFAEAIPTLFERFHHVDRETISTGRTYADRDLLLDATREFCDRIFGQFIDGEADRVAERTPAHVQHIDLMCDLYPDAYYIHIYRDGRDAIRSLASMDWYHGSLEDAAAEWRESVLAPRSSRRPERYMEVQYEQLLADPRTKIIELYEFLELEIDHDIIERALREARLELNTDPGSSVGAEKWRELLSPKQQASILAIAGDALEAYGYASADEIAAARDEAGSRGGLPIDRLVRRVRGRA